MTTHETLRRFRAVVYLLAVFLALPPGFATQVLAANLRTSALTHDGLMETFRNPQFSSPQHNRFLHAQQAQSLLGGAGGSFTNPDTAGLGGPAELETLWLTNGGALEWFDRDVYVPGVGLPLMLQRVYRGSVSSYAGPLGQRWEFNWNKRLFVEADDDVVFHELGRHETYDEDSGDYASPAGRYDTLVLDTGPDPDEYTRTDKQGITEAYEYDSDEAGTTWYRLAEIADLNGNTLSFLYDGGSHLTTVTDTLARDTTLAYDGLDRLTKLTDSASREWVYGYDGSGQLTSVRTPTVDEAGSEDDYTSGKTTKYKYDGSGRLTEVLRPNDSSTGTWLWAYDASGHVTTQTKSGNASTIAYDEGNGIVTVLDREGEETRYEYNGSNLITKRRVFETSSTSWDTTYSYNGDTEVTSVIFPLGNRIVYTYDGDGNVLTVAFLSDGEDASPITWSYTYANHARISTLTDPNGNTWTYGYDANGNLTAKDAPAVTVPTDIATEDKNGNSIYDGTIAESWTYNGSGLVTAWVDPVGVTTAFEYTTVNGDAAYLAHVISDAGGLDLTRSHTYDATGNVTSSTTPEGDTTTYTVNDLNQVILAVEPLLVTKKYHFDLNDRLTKTEASNDTDIGDSWYVVQYVYDQSDNRTTMIEDSDATPGSLTTKYLVDKNDRVTKHVSPRASETHYRYDPRDLVIWITRGSSGTDPIQCLHYDNNGRRSTACDPRGHQTHYFYDLYNRMTEIEQPEENSIVHVFDDAGNVLTTQWKRSGGTVIQETRYHYDQANRLYQTDKVAKQADLSTLIGDGLQNQTSWHDERGRVLEHTGDVCGCANYAHVYDAVGRTVTTKDPMGESDGTRNLVLTEYDKNGYVTKTTRNERTQDDGIEDSFDIETTMVYDVRDRLLTRTEKLSAGASGHTQYFYGIRDQVTKVIDAHGNERRMTYDEQLWIASETLENGSSDVVTSCFYDRDGNMTTYRAANAETGNQDTRYFRDHINRLTKIAWPDGGQHVYVLDNR
jgi:YD repeat-containing protein